MTYQNNEERSLYEERASTWVGLLGLAAAAAAWQVVRLFTAARAASGISSKTLAERMSVTEGRVSQILSGEGNVHIATAARVLRAMGYELTLTAVPVDPGKPPLVLNRRGPRKQAVARPDRAYDVYAQMFLTHEGPRAFPLLVPAHDTLRTTPYGTPVKLGEVTISDRGQVRPIRPIRPEWQAKATEKPRLATT